MFSAVTSDTKMLRDSIDTISQLIDEGIFKLKRDGIEMIATDRAMVAVLDFKMSSAAFDEYKCETEKEIGLNILNFLTILKRANSDDKLKIELKDDNKLQITLKGSSTRKFSVPLLDLAKDEIPPVDQLDFSAMAKVKADVIEEGINDADIIADSVIFEMSDGMMRMSSEGDSSKTELVLERGNESLIELNTKQEVKSRYPLDYLKKIIKGARISDTAKMQIGADYPMKIEFKGDNVSLTCILAPRVSED